MAVGSRSSKGNAELPTPVKDKHDVILIARTHIKINSPQPISRKTRPGNGGISVSGMAYRGAGPTSMGSSSLVLMRSTLPAFSSGSTSESESSESELASFTSSPAAAAGKTRAHSRLK